MAEYDRVLQTPQVSSQLSKYSDFMKQLTQWTGKNISTVWDMYYLYHTLMAEYSMGYVLPSWAYEIFPYGRLWNGTLLSYEVANFSPLERRLFAGMPISLTFCLSVLQHICKWEHVLVKCRIIDHRLRKLNAIQVWTISIAFLIFNYYCHHFTFT